MIIRPISDLHLEVASFKPTPLETDAETCLVIAGDLSSLKTSRGCTAPLRGFLEGVSVRFKYIVYVPGNHEFYGSEVGKAKACLREMCQEHKNVYLLDDTSVTLDGITFLGSTLWADIKNLVDRIAVRRYVNDYTAITYHEEKLIPLDTVNFHNKSVRFLEKNIRQNSIVVTHHLPSYKSIDQKYVRSPINSAWATNLESLIVETKPKLWIHGHTHSSFDYNIGNTRVVCNPRGYYNENVNFDAVKLIHV